MQLNVRRICTIVEDKFEEAGRASEQSLRRAAIVAVVQNPFVGRFVEDLTPLIEVSSSVGARMAECMAEAFGDEEIQAYGKGGIVGLYGEQEHANALLTTTFATPFRAKIPGSSAWISSFTKVGVPGVPIDIPMNAVTDVYVRSHYHGFSVVLPDSPLPDEIALIFCMANRGRLNARVGGMSFEESKSAAQKA
jgi:amino acid synthesis protein